MLRFPDRNISGDMFLFVVNFLRLDFKSTHLWKGSKSKLSCKKTGHPMNSVRRDMNSWAWALFGCYSCATTRVRSSISLLKFLFLWHIIAKWSSSSKVIVFVLFKITLKLFVCRLLRWLMKFCLTCNILRY